MTSAIDKEYKKVMTTLRKYGAASSERLAKITHLPRIAVNFAMYIARKEGLVDYTKAELWVFTEKGLRAKGHGLP